MNPVVRLPTLVLTVSITYVYVRTVVRYAAHIEKFLYSQPLPYYPCFSREWVLPPKETMKAPTQFQFGLIDYYNPRSKDPYTLQRDYYHTKKSLM